MRNLSGGSILLRKSQAREIKLKYVIYCYIKLDK